MSEEIKKEPKKELTAEQIAAIGARGKVIVSASAGSGKTFVMIKKIANLIESGGDLDEILATTFTKKAAAQMKDKLRAELISRLSSSDEKKKAHLKSQLAKIPSADITTIHSFCSRLVRTYFYALGTDATFEIIHDEDAQCAALQARAVDSVFTRFYEEDDADFKFALSRLRKSRSDDNLRKLIFDAYKSIRIIADYRERLDEMQTVYCKEGFLKVCDEYRKYGALKFEEMKGDVTRFAATFNGGVDDEGYRVLFSDMLGALEEAKTTDIFSVLPKLTVASKPRVKPETAQASNEYGKFRAALARKYGEVYKGLADGETEYKIFMESGLLVKAFCKILLAFDDEYTAIKHAEGKLDCNDLEHLTLKLLKDDEIRSRINAKYRHIFVDEYQDVNPVQERLLSEVGANDAFMVGDVKQAIYGFRGSKSLFFAQKYNKTMEGGGAALKLTSNFRSSNGVINFVNKLFSASMKPPVYDFNYAGGSEMSGGDGYPKGYGKAEICVFGKDEPQTQAVDGVYSVVDSVQKPKGHTREGLAVLEIIKRELAGEHYDLKSKDFVPTTAGDICILVRKRGSASTSGIVRALTDAGIPVAAAAESNICDRTEVREMIEILSFIDNSQQDLPLITALTSPLGALSREELARIRLAMPYSRDKRYSFRECVVWYYHNKRDKLAQKIGEFYYKILSYRKLAEVLGAARLIDKICDDNGLTATYSAGGGEKLRSIRRLAAEAYSSSGELSLNAFLAKIKASDFKIKAAPATASDSVKIMTMHNSKGLEFPVVIVADAAASFKGPDEYSDMPFDEVFGFAPKFYDESNRLRHPTVLRRLCFTRNKREVLKNELNLYYVACTRAMCNLYVMTSEISAYSESAAGAANTYAQLCDFSAFKPVYMTDLKDFDAEEQALEIIGEPDKEVYEKINGAFMKPYAYGQSVDLPVKSSASCILKDRNFEESRFAENEMFKEAPETGADRGTAYHRFLELCDFSVKDKGGIAAELDGFEKSGLLGAEQRALLDIEHLSEILNMEVFDCVKGATLYREREFLCELPANEFLQTQADDGVLCQGAIDLLAVGENGTAIIDYKYSKKDDDNLVEKYSLQLALYKKAVSRILKIDEKFITTTIVNIFARREIKLKNI